MKAKRVMTVTHKIMWYNSFTIYGIGSVWYMCLKIENYYLKIFVKICMGKKVR